MMILLDGIQDRAYPQLNGKTPREAGKGEGFARFEREGKTARLATTPEGFEPDTLACTLTLMGLTPDKLPAGRSCLEALAEGFAVGEQDLIMRCNFVKVTPDGLLEVPCCTPPDEIADALMAEVKKRHGSPLKRIGGYKCLQLFPGARDSISFIKTYPPHNYQGHSLQEIMPHGDRFADSLGETSRELLEQYAPYTVFNWGQSVQEKLPSFQQMHGKKGALITKTLVLEGVARAMEMTCPQVDGATGETDTNLLGKAQAALELLGDHDFVILHVGGTDEVTHRQDPVEKAEFIARIDRELLLPLTEGCPDGTRIVLTSDHEALCSTAGHTAEPVEAFVWTKGAPTAGDFGLLPGVEAIPRLCQ